jgi:hypothetical protein
MPIFLCESIEPLMSAIEAATEYVPQVQGRTRHDSKQATKVGHGYL